MFMYEKWNRDKNYVVQEGRDFIAQRKFVGTIDVNKLFRDESTRRLHDSDTNLRHDTITVKAHGKVIQ